MPAYRIEILQIPCKTKGDCSLHLLIEYNPDENDRRGKIASAVLMDGGLTKTEDNIKLAFAKVQETYGRLQLDAMVITHWDDDHYLGVKAFFANKINRDTYLLHNDSVPGKLATRLYCPTTPENGRSGDFLKMLLDGKDPRSIKDLQVRTQNIITPY